MSKKVIPYQIHEVNDPVPLKSRVAFKRPLSAHERVIRAIKSHDALRRLDSQPGDESFDSPPYDELTPHQLVTDPDSGEEMTAAEHVMLQEERRLANEQVNTALQRRAQRAAAAKRKKAKALPEPVAEEVEETETDEAD